MRNILKWIGILPVSLLGMLIQTCGLAEEETSSYQFQCN
jgi:hypothetical protein